MSQRNSEYARIEGDSYITPRWVFDALYTVEEFDLPFDPAPPCSQFDFLAIKHNSRNQMVTNPPFKLAESFVRHALALTGPIKGKVAMLLPMVWDAAKSRRDLFELRPFKAKYTITRRIRWENLEQKKNGPSTNHAWFVWDWSYRGKPFLGYLPKQEAA